MDVKSLHDLLVPALRNPYDRARLVFLASETRSLSACARTYAMALTHCFPEDRAQVAQNLRCALFGFEPGHSAPGAWWRTELGQVVFAAGGFPDRNASVTEASGALQVSHARIWQLVTGGKLVDVGREDGFPIERASLYARHALLAERPPGR